MKGSLHERIPKIINDLEIVKTNQFFDFIKVHQPDVFEQIQAKYSLWEYELEKQVKSIENDNLEKNIVDWINLMFLNNQPLESIISDITKQKEWIIKHKLTELVKETYKKGKLAYLYKKVS